MRRGQKIRGMDANIRGRGTHDKCGGEGNDKGMRVAAMGEKPAWKHGRTRY